MKKRGRRENLGKREGKEGKKRKERGSVLTAFNTFNPVLTEI